MRSPEFGGSNFEGETALSILERNEMLADLARMRQEMAQRYTAAEIARYPELLAMLSKLIEGGPELSTQATAHLRRMIALSFNFYNYAQQASDAEADERFQGIVAGTIQQELDELSSIAEGDSLPDLWDIAYEDLMRLESP